MEFFVTAVVVFTLTDVQVTVAENASGTFNICISASSVDSSFQVSIPISNVTLDVNSTYPGEGTHGVIWCSFPAYCTIYGSFNFNC